jgi:glutamine---fructose-6-phosphate transaminase (isomerizing)
MEMPLGECLMNPYLADILAQPTAIRDALAGFEASRLKDAAERLCMGKLDRVVIAGMGTSLSGSLPAWQTLVDSGIAAWCLDASELLHTSPALITPRTLLWLVSQSGRSAEILALLESGCRPGYVLVTANDETSPAARKADSWIPMSAGIESTVATKTYLNTLVINRLAALALAGKTAEEAVRQATAASEAAAAYLSRWEYHVDELGGRIPAVGKLVVTGRGISLASAETAGLILKESAKVAAQGLSSAQFRHGPLELADPTLTLLVFEGEGAAIPLNRKLVRDAAAYGAQAFLVTSGEGEGQPTIECPSAEGIGLPIAEILPIQMLSMVLARRNGFEPGAFRHSGKITGNE